MENKYFSQVIEGIRALKSVCVSVNSAYGAFEHELDMHVQSVDKEQQIEVAVCLSGIYNEAVGYDVKEFYVSEAYGYDDESNEVYLTEEQKCILEKEIKAKLELSESMDSDASFVLEEMPVRRYAANLNFYVYAKSEKEAKELARKEAEFLDSKLDSSANITSIIRA